jgi:DNA polymerase (family X)
MPYSNAEIASIFEEVADLLEIDGANPFRVRAYRQAAENINDYGPSLADKVEADDDLTRLSGIGKDLAGAIADLTRTGTYPDLDALRERVNPSLRDMLRIPGLGPKKVKRLHDELGINTLEDLQKAVDTNQLADLSGFGKRSEEKIAKELASGRLKKSRRLRADLEPVAISLVESISAVADVEQADSAGSYRRKRDTIGDLDIIASAENSGSAIAAFVNHELVEQVTNEGETRAAAVLRNGVTCDLRVIPPQSYGAALLYFTGSKDHNIDLRQRAIKRKLKLNEYGLWTEDDKLVAGETEESVYQALELSYIEPEMRENRGEIQLAATDDLPTLITLQDIRGDIHSHTTWSDGKSSIEEMTKAAIAKGYEYLAITDHSPRLAMTRGLTPERLQQQAVEIHEVQQKHPEIRILHGNEVDILKDGSLDQPDEALAELEIVIASIHSHFDLSREEQTERLLKAIENPYVRIIGHPQGRILTQRDPILLDMEQVLTAARDAGVVMEINADPHRLDLDDSSVFFGRELEVKFVINTDAHRISSFDLMRHGVYQARRGWLEAQNVVNTGNLQEMLASLRQKP